MASTNGSLKTRVTRQGEETLGKLAQDLLQNPVVHGALSTMFETRERAGKVQEVAMGALNLPSASDLARLTRRLRSVSQRIEGLEDGLDRVVERLDQMRDPADVRARLEAIEQTLLRLEGALATGAAATESADVSGETETAKPATRRRSAKAAAGTGSAARKTGTGSTARKTGTGSTARKTGTAARRSSAKKQT